MSDTIDEHIAERIRTARIERGESQSKLGKRVGLSTQQIWKYEMAVSQLTASRLAQFAQALDRPLTFFYENLDLLTGTSANRILGGSSAVKSSEGRMTLLHAYGQLDGANRSILISIAKSLAETRNEKPHTDKSIEPTGRRPSDC
jgi:transcriptional regulator with XRE-family HTH domain